MKKENLKIINKFASLLIKMEIELERIYSEENQIFNKLHEAEVCNKTARNMEDILCNTSSAMEYIADARKEFDKLQKTAKEPEFWNKGNGTGEFYKK